MSEISVWNILLPLFVPSPIMNLILDIPFDILTEIVGHLDSKHDVNSLRSLSTTCHAFCEPSQRRLFHSLKLGMHLVSPDLTPTYLSFHNLLNRSPHIANYVRNLDYLITPSDGWTATIPSILGKLNGIESLELYAWKGRVDWSHLTPTWREALRSILGGQCLRHLRLFGELTIPLSSVIASPGLTSLDIGRVLILTDDSLPLLNDSLHFEKLTVHYIDHNARSAIVALLDACPITNLHFKHSVQGKDVPPVFRILPFYGLGNIDPHGTPVSATLRSLSFSIWISGASSPLNNLGNHLNAFSADPDNVLESLHFEFTSDISRLRDLPELISELEEEICWSKFGHLRVVTIELVVQLGEWAFGPALASLAKKRGEDIIGDVFLQLGNHEDIEVRRTVKTLDAEPRRPRKTSIASYA